MHVFVVASLECEKLVVCAGLGDSTFLDEVAAETNASVIVRQKHRGTERNVHAVSVLNRR